MLVLYLYLKSFLMFLLEVKIFRINVLGWLKLEKVYGNTKKKNEMNVDFVCPSVQGCKFFKTNWTILRQIDKFVFPSP